MSLTIENTDYQKLDIKNQAPVKKRTSILTDLKGNKDEIQTKNNYIFIIFNIILSQILALLAVSNGLASTKLQNTFNIDIPVIIVFLYYSMIFLVYFFNFRIFKKPNLSYFLISIFDSQGNYLNIYAFQFITFSYPFVINISTILWTFLFTYLFIKTYKYKFSHFIGTLISVIGIGLSLYGYMTNIKDDMNNNLHGILLCIASSLLYSLSSIVQEINFKSGTDIYDFFPWFGLIGMILTGVEAYFFKNYHSFIDNIDKFNYEVILYTIASFGTLFCFVSIVPFFIKRLSASMFNISQVSQIFWSFLIGKFIFHEQSEGNDSSFYIGFLLIIIGIVIYNNYPVKEIVNKEESNQLDSMRDDSSESQKKSTYVDKKSDYYKNRSLYINSAVMN